MVRLIYIVSITIPFIIFYLIKCNYIASHIDEYSDDERYLVAQKMIKIIKTKGRIDTEIFGVDNLPKEGGYVMYPNHQGKYDTLGIIWAHKEPCTFVIDKKRSKLILANEITKILKASRLDKTNLKTQVKIIQDVSNQVKNGKRYIIFPEGGYNDNNNIVHEFLPGAFKCSVRVNAPIVPVALIDSYKPFGLNSLKRIKTQVHFLKPLYYEDYKTMTTVEIAEFVRNQIINVVEAC